MDEESSSISNVWSINSVTTILVFVFTFCLAFLSTRRQHGVPPGPSLWPIIGNIPSLISRDVLGRLGDLRQIYGDIYGLYIGSELNIFLNGYDVIQEALVKNGTLFSRRPFTRYTSIILKDKTAIVFGNDRPWKKLRTIALNGLGHICFTDKGHSLEAKINEEIACFIKKLQTTTQPMDPSGHVNLSFANVIFFLVHGKRIGYNNKDFNWYMDHLDRAFKTLAKKQVQMSCFPFLKHLPFDLLSIQSSKKNFELLRTYYHKMFAENLKNYTEGSTNCLFDWYLTSILKESTGNEKKPINEYFNDDRWLVFHDLMAAGSETSATTLKWIMLHLCLDQGVQRKLQAEIDSKLGPDAIVSLSDRIDLPYVEACVLEGLRIGTVVPLAVPHGVNEDTWFKGYFIQKDVQILANVASVLKDPNIFQDPETFIPERFLSKNLKEIVIPKEFIPFSFGPRSCIGETLAKMELFLYTTTLFQKFDLELGPSLKPPSTAGVFGITYHPNEFKIHFLPRIKTRGP